MRRLHTAVFNNPFDSFHNMVAEAKEEREQLDRLLTISTPRERQLVAVIAVLLLLLAAWLFFGSVARSLALDGELVVPGKAALEGHRAVQTLVWVKRELAGQVRAGMPVVIELNGVDGKSYSLDGEVADISATRWSAGQAVLESAAQAVFGSATPVPMHRLEILLEERLDVTSLASRACRVRIELSRQAPIARFRVRQP